jgi:hypothetical protein
MTDILTIIVIIVVVYLLLVNLREPFSSGGLALSNSECDNLVDVFYRHNMKDPKCRKMYHDRICGKTRRHIIEPRRGNWFTDHGQLM